MRVWHVWGDYCHTRPDSIGPARIVHDDRGRARKTAEANGFDFQRRLRNGFEPWAAEFAGDEPVIAFSPHYLLDGVVAATATVGHGDAHAPDSTRVRLQFTSSSKPAVITRPTGASAGNGFRYLVVPQRVQQ